MKTDGSKLHVRMLMANGMIEVIKTDIPHPHLVLLVLPGVWKAWDDSRDPGSRGNLAGVDHNQELHQIIIDLPRSTLDNVDVLPTYTLSYLNTAKGE